MLHPKVSITEPMFFMKGEQVYVTDVGMIGTLEDLTENGCWIVRFENGQWGTVYDLQYLKAVAYVH